MKFTSAAAVAAVLLSTPAIAQDADWTGFYGSLGLSGSNFSTGGSATKDYFTGVSIGAGYLMDAGSLAYGGEISYQGANSNDKTIGERLDATTLKGIVGYQFGQNLVFASAGAVNTKLSGVLAGTDQMRVMGIGARRTFMDNYVGVIEVTRAIDNDFLGSGMSLKNDAITLRVDYKF
jgi:outer membrane immunogenic protein